jgi:hypothetical protein
LRGETPVLMTGATMIKSRVREARDAAADLADEIETLKDALRRLETGIEQMADGIEIAKMKVKASVAEVISAECLDGLIDNYTKIEARRAEERMILTAVWSLVLPQDSKRVNLALAERPFIPGAEPPPRVRAWQDFLGALATDPAAAPLPGV